MRSEWTNVLTHGDSAGRKVHYWVTTGTQVTPAGDTVKWELRQTYDAITLQPYSIVRTATNGALSSLQIDGRRVHGTRRANANAPMEQLDYTIDRPGFVASASDLVPAAVGFKAGRVISVQIWGPNMTQSEQRLFTIVGKSDVNVEGTVVNAWKVEERRQSDLELLATWYLLDKSPYMVYGEVPLTDGSIQRMTEVEVPMPQRRAPDQNSSQKRDEGRQHEQASSESEFASVADRGCGRSGVAAGASCRRACSAATHHHPRDGYRGPDRSTGSGRDCASGTHDHDRAHRCLRAIHHTSAA
jgi:hypothetical protein